MKKFCIAGPIDPERHYFIPKRLNQSEVDTLIDDREYFVLHAPRQSGKTTAIEEYIDYLNAKGFYNALYINIEPAQAARDNVKEALISILTEFKTSLHNQLKGQEATIQYIEKILSQPHLVTFNTVVEMLEFWTEVSPQPKVLFIDEVDSLIGDSLLSLLRQIRRGFSKRPEHFPQSICLIGLRDVRDYRVWSQESGVYISTSSPFNIRSPGKKKFHRRLSHSKQRLSIYGICRKKMIRLHLMSQRLCGNFKMPSLTGYTYSESQ